MHVEETRAQILQRLQIGVIGIVAILSMVGLANLILTRASNEQRVDAEEDVAAGEPRSGPLEKNAEPLADLGVAPSLPAEQRLNEPLHQQQGGVTPLEGTVPDLQKSPRQPPGQ